MCDTMMLLTMMLLTMMLDMTETVVRQNKIQDIIVNRDRVRDRDRDKRHILCSMIVLVLWNSGKGSVPSERAASVPSERAASASSSSPPVESTRVRV